MPIDEFIRSLEADGWTVRHVTKRQPHTLQIRRGDELRRLRVYIWNVTAGGPSDVRGPDERRIQKMVRGPLVIGAGATTLLLGWHEETGVFVSWNPLVHRNAAYSTSIHVPQRRLDEAAARGIAVHPRVEPPEVVVALAHRTVSQLLTGIDELPLHTDDAEEAELIARASEEGDLSLDDLTGNLEERRQTAVKVRRWSREASFRPRVLAVYGEACAFCGLGLGLVQAAHIVPVSEEDSSDETSNGLALCPTCHAAFDTNLLGLLPDYSIVVNRETVERLGAARRARGFRGWLRRLRRRARVPNDPELSPNPAYVRRRLDLAPGNWDPIRGRR